MAAFVEYYLHVSQLKPFPFDQFSCLADLCEAILRRFSRERLLSNPGAKQSRGNFFQPPEAPFQDEWYRAFSSLVGHGVGISSKWSPQDNGRVDFRIIGPAWGVEVLRDGDQLSEVCDRFQENGRYHPLIADARLKDWLILDCRHSRPQKYRMIQKTPSSSPSEADSSHQMYRVLSFGESSSKKTTRRRMFWVATIL
ncbi:hypothetical protein EYZ11_005515 [Aspergillus tanneri]|uniref:Fungal-type protein kinase domain-containing protein n=1 Tax=Aspergillus tanneri TaxID=1220188 RepID=A0A4S3JI01_9EURO|nr:hypothetical protein EYZ11_005515 [Aspergillus tanneri]